ncbi:MAG: type I CRISPR-associated protein Cas7 [Lewinellaceae bacterium]|nr:type I CRISPR-associated protein Cas7 [Lewinellaceae bacterium]
MANPFTQRAFGCAVIKSVNSNYNADFTHQPRTLPDGTVYATDKALKYTVRNYFKSLFPDEKVFYFRSLSDDLQPRTLDENCVAHFGDFPKEKEKELRKLVLKNLLSCLDVRLFGGTFAVKSINLSLHGPVQVSHGINRFIEGVIYSEQIMSPFRNPGEKQQDSTMTTLGAQSKLKEGHYVHHFSVNPQNLEGLAQLSEGQPLTGDDIQKLKEGLSRGATLYDSAAKAGTENELLLWVQLKPGSMLVLPSFVEKVSVGEDRAIDLSAVSAILERPSVENHIDTIEVYRDPGTAITGAPVKAQYFEIHR